MKKNLNVGVTCIQIFYFIPNIPNKLNKLENLYSFTKEERLKSEVEISLVYNSGEKTFSHPFKVYFLKKKSDNLTQLDDSIDQGKLRICISVPKRKFKKAVDRNLIKRRTREAFRLNKHTWYNKIEKINVDLYLIFIGNEISEYANIEKSMVKILNSV